MVTMIVNTLWAYCIKLMVFDTDSFLCMCSDLGFLGVGRVWVIIPRCQDLLAVLCFLSESYGSHHGFPDRRGCSSPLFHPFP